MGGGGGVMTLSLDGMLVFHTLSTPPIENVFDKPVRLTQLGETENCYACYTRLKRKEIQVHKSLTWCLLFLKSPSLVVQ